MKKLRCGFSLVSEPVKGMTANPSGRVTIPEPNFGKGYYPFNPFERIGSSDQATSREVRWRSLPEIEMWGEVYKVFASNFRTLFRLL